MRIELVHAGINQAVLVLSPTKGNDKAAKTKKSTVLVVPFTAPRASTIANAMGRAAASAQWLVQNDAEAESSKSGVQAAESAEGEADMGEHAVLKEIQLGLESGNVAEAFFKWVGEDKRKRKILADKDKMEIDADSTAPRKKKTSRTVRCSLSPLCFMNSTRYIDIV